MTEEEVLCGVCEQSFNGLSMYQCTGCGVDCCFHCAVLPHECTVLSEPVIIQFCPQCYSHFNPWDSRIKKIFESYQAEAALLTSEGLASMEVIHVL